MILAWTRMGELKRSGHMGGHVLKVELTGVAKGLDAETRWEGDYRNKKTGRAKVVTSRFLP